ncbi:MAG TPA: MupA/Atu3671 family FMN-dependent luciferase-like monooxygenase [Vicinamibacteria bacterium]|jgi:natural product biosynthesis luciferase-like monooxygenase protein
MKFSLFYFSTNEAEYRSDKYRLVLEGARFADRNGFEAIWTPERHFHSFGGIFPNPSVLSAGLATMTERIDLRAGSVVLPLHDPVRVAEEWSVVDNLSGGRVGIAVAVGYSPNDFVLAPSLYATRKEAAFAKIETVRRLWRGETVTLTNGAGKPVEVRIFPMPTRPELPLWITCGGADKEKFAEAGALGANVLTALFVLNVDTLRDRIAAYRGARAAAGLDPAAGQVTLMVHAFIGDSVQAVRDKVRRPFIDYLRTSVDVWSKGYKRLEDVPQHRREDMLAFAFERYFRTSALFGTPETCLEMVEGLREAGVDELACLIDFGVDREAVIDSLGRLDALRRRAAYAAPAAVAH